MECRVACGACCIAPSISSSIPGMLQGKAANTPCIQLDEQMKCQLFDSPLRPSVCSRFQPSLAMCGNNRHEALRYLIHLEQETRP